MQILERLIEFGSLDLSAFELEDLPTALANLPAKRINVPDSTFTKLSSPPAWQNLHVREVFVPDSIKPSPLRRLCAYFPNWKDTYFYSKGYELACADSIQAQRNHDMEKARLYAEQAIVFLRHISKAKRDFDYYHARAHAYHNSGRYNMALYCYHYIEEQYAIEEYKDCLYDMACSYARLQNKPSMLDKLARYMRLYTHDMADFLLKDDDMVAYHQDEDVLALIEAHTHLPTQTFQKYAKRFLLA
jgi:tetratricopeptide (TPR) repeat protein